MDTHGPSRKSSPPPLSLEKTVDKHSHTPISVGGLWSVIPRMRGRYLPSSGWGSVSPPFFRLPFLYWSDLATCNVAVILLMG